MSDALVLFAKAPIPGRVKTRLVPPLTAEQAAEFHWACVCDVWDKIEEVSASSRYFYSDELLDVALAGPDRRGVQRGGDLGDRMLNCFLELRDRGHTRVLIVGSDSPTLPTVFLSQGLEGFEHADAVLGPSEDGGYYAIGCRQPHPQMFADVPWSSAETLQQTEANLRSLSRTIHKLPPWYDVDTIADLRRLAGEASLPFHVGRWMAANQSLLA